MFDKHGYTDGRVGGIRAERSRTLVVRRSRSAVPYRDHQITEIILLSDGFDLGEAQIDHQNKIEN